MCPNTQFLADLVTLTEEILNGKLHFLCTDSKKTFPGNVLKKTDKLNDLTL